MWDDKGADAPPQSRPPLCCPGACGTQPPPLCTQHLTVSNLDPSSYGVAPGSLHRLDVGLLVEVMPGARGSMVDDEDAELRMLTNTLETRVAAVPKPASQQCDCRTPRVEGQHA